MHFSPYQKYFVKKTQWYLLTLVVAVSLNFFLPRMIKGNPVDLIVSQVMGGMADSDSTKAVKEQFVRQFGLDKPLIVQFFIYIGNLFKGQMGVSIGQYPRTVEEILSTSIWWTIGLQLPAILAGWLIGNALGALAAYKKGIFDKTLFPLSIFITSIPVFSLSIILLYQVCLKWGWFPIGGGYGYDILPSWSLAFFISIFRHYQMPFLSIVLVFIGGQAIGMRSMSIYELNEDYVLYGKLMGVRDSKIARYIFRNAALPQVSGLALALGRVVAGALITEVVFSYPGIGTWLFRAIRTLDYPLISGCTLIVTLTLLIANFAIELIYGLIDPRVKAAQIEES
jgi:peptide/nickel transport system permease protein